MYLELNFEKEYSDNFVIEHLDYDFIDATSLTYELTDDDYLIVNEPINKNSLV